MIFEDVSPDKYRDVKDYYIKLAKKTTLYLEKSGFKYCSNNHMASNLMWCKSISDWKRQYESWILNPGDKTTPLSSIFFDYEFVYGDTILENQITDSIYNFQKSYSLLFDFMGNEALKHPAAFNFFKKLIVEENTPNKGKFDIKNRGLLPFIDAARLLTISQKIRGVNNTYLRFKQLAITESKFAELYKNCAESFLLLSKLSVLEGFNNDNSGQFLTVDEISKTDLEKIKNALLPIKDLEDLIKDKFQLTHFS